MAEGPDDLVLELLKRIQGTLNGMALDISDLKTRMTTLEGQMGQMTQMLGHLEVQQAATNKRIDRLDERVGRIERRLDLTEA